MINQVLWPELNIDPASVDLSGSDGEVIRRLAKKLNPTVPSQLFEEGLKYACYSARQYYVREEGIVAPVLTQEEEAQIRSKVVETLQDECIIRSLSKSVGIELSEAEEEEELLARKNSSGVSVKQLRKYYRHNSVQANERYLSMLRTKLLKYLRGVQD